MRILYLSAHAILEYDELKLFEELGYDYFSLGSYIDPKKPSDSIRPALTHEPRKKLYSMLPKDKNMLTVDFLKEFDVVIVMHVPEWIHDNAEAFKEWGGRVIWRTIGQSTPKIEMHMSKHTDWLQIVRYSPREQFIENYAGHHNIIRFYKDPEEFDGYTGVDRKVITFSQDMKQRAEFCSYDAYREVIKDLPAKLYGPKNENSGEINGGFLTYDEMRQKMRDSRVYFYTGTQPASYTLNFIEALMTGIPIVALGDEHANSMRIAGDTYEIPDIIQHGINGFCSNNLDELKSLIKKLLDNHKFAQRIGYLGRDTALQLFNKAIIKKQWKALLEE